jgi:hypothetical protein
MRIYALIRLGIDDNEKLHISLIFRKFHLCLQNKSEEQDPLFIKRIQAEGVGN